MFNLELTRDWKDVYGLVEQWGKTNVENPHVRGAWTVRGRLMLGALEHWGQVATEEYRTIKATFDEIFPGEDFGTFVVVIPRKPTKTLLKALREDFGLNPRATDSPDEYEYVTLKRLKTSFGGTFSVVLVIASKGGVIDNYGTITGAFSLPLDDTSTSFFMHLARTYGVTIDGKTLEVNAPKYQGGPTTRVPFMDPLSFWEYVSDVLQGDTTVMRKVAVSMVRIEMMFYKALRAHNVEALEGRGQ